MSGRSQDDFPVVPRRDRIHVLREFILQKFQVHHHLRKKGADADKGYILDVAGGRGDFSFVLCNADRLQAVVVDPRRPDHYKIARTCQWYSEHPDEAAEQAQQGQALAGLALQPPFRVPQHLRMFFESDLIRALEGDVTEWNSYWESTQRRIEKLETAFKPHHQKKEVGMVSDDKSSMNVAGCVVDSSVVAREILNSVALVIGFHPDEATDACIDFALARRLPFCVCPCCVFPSLFTHRRLKDGRSVSSYTDYITYLQEKHPNMRVEKLPFHSSATGHGAGLARNTVLYMLASDYDVL